MSETNVYFAPPNPDLEAQNPDLIAKENRKSYERTACLIPPYEGREVETRATEP